LIGLYITTPIYIRHLVMTAKPSARALLASVSGSAAVG